MQAGQEDGDALLVGVLGPQELQPLTNLKLWTLRPTDISGWDI